MRQQTIFQGLFILFSTLYMVQPSLSSSADEDDDFDWFEQDIRELTRDVNEGELEFLVQLPEKPVHHHQNFITLDAESLQDGWVQLRQCHHHIDNVGRAQIMFRKGGIRDLRITESSNISQAWVEGASVQLKDIKKDSSLCIEAESLALTALGNDIYRLKNGPYMRRFLDGYYPMRVSMQVDFADSGLRFTSIKPTSQPGFRVESNQDSIRYEAWFEGRLLTEIELVNTKSTLAAK